MPYCAVLRCRNDSHSMNLSNMGISYHRFPNEPELKEKWINATGRQNWLPTKTSTICSLHFKDVDFLQKTDGNKYLVRTAVPSSNLLSFIKQEDTIFELKLLNPTLEERECKLEQDSDSDSMEVFKSTTASTTSIMNPKKIRDMENRIKRQQLIINKVLAQNRRMKDKIDKYEEIISACIKKKKL